MPIIRPNKIYLRKYSPLTPLPLTPLRIPMIKHSETQNRTAESKVRVSKPFKIEGLDN